MAERDAAALASRASSVYTSAATAAADDEGNGYRNVTYFFPNPRIESTDEVGGVLAFAKAETEANYLRAHAPRLKLCIATAFVFLAAPLGLLAEVGLLAERCALM